MFHRHSTEENGKHTSGIGYRPDIDGLRALSILLVLAYHFGVPLLPGGFVGVDVFFVISGYLITALILDEFRVTGHVSLWNFWARRVRRLAPALFLTLGTVMVASTVFMSRIGGETGPVAKAAIATLLLNANHFFLLESGAYFAAAAAINPLLHMWSLSVEEQFYVFWPLLLLAVLRRRESKKLLPVIIVLLCGALVAAAVMATFTRPEASFYVMPARAWELLMGGVLATLVHERRYVFSQSVASLLAVAGLVLIAASTLMMTGAAYFPFPLALAPVVGAVFLLFAGASNSLNWVSRMLSLPGLVYIGKISYPLYLWHWPALVMSRSQRLYEPSPWLDLLAVSASFAFAVFTYEVIERRAMRSMRRFGSPRKVITLGGLASIALLCGACALGAWARFGWGYSDHDKALAAARMDFPQTGCIFEKSFPDPDALKLCFPQSTEPSVLLWGDSHAAQWGPAFKAAAHGQGINVGILALAGCLPLPGAELRPNCQTFNDRVVHSLAGWRSDRRLTGIILTGRWGHQMGVESPTLSERSLGEPAVFFDHRASSTSQAMHYLSVSLTEVLDEARRHGLRVLIILPSPILTAKAPHCLSAREAQDCFVTLDEMSRYAGAVEAVIRNVAAGDPQIRLIDPKSFLCMEGRCPARLFGAVAYSDSNHLSNTVSLATAPQFAADLAWLARRN